MQFCRSKIWSTRFWVSSKKITEQSVVKYAHLLVSYGLTQHLSKSNNFMKRTLWNYMWIAFVLLRIASEINLQNIYWGASTVLASEKKEIKSICLWSYYKRKAEFLLLRNWLKMTRKRSKRIAKRSLIYMDKGKRRNFRKSRQWWVK